jgi:hypothetical protein
MNIPEKLNRVRFEWADESKTHVISVQDDDGPFIISNSNELHIRYRPKTELDFLFSSDRRGNKKPTTEVAMGFCYEERNYSTSWDVYSM